MLDNWNHKKQKIDFFFTAQMINVCINNKFIYVKAFMIIKNHRLLSMEIYLESSDIRNLWKIMVHALAPMHMGAKQSGIQSVSE